MVFEIFILIIYLSVIDTCNFFNFHKMDCIWLVVDSIRIAFEQLLSIYMLSTVTLKKQIPMQKLIQEISSKAGISEQQALIAANTTKDFIKEKVPFPLSGMVDQFFAGQFDPASALKAATEQQSDWMSKAKEAAQEAGEKFSAFGHEATEKMNQMAHDAVDKGSEFAKEAASHMNEWAKQAGGWSEEALQKFKSMFASK